MTVGFESFRIFDVGKTFRDKTSAGENLFSPFIEILGFKWCVGIENEENEFFLESICTVKTKKSNLYFSFHFYKIIISK